MHAGMFVALACIAPVDHKHASVGPATQVDPAKPGIAGQHHVVAMLGDVAAAVSLQDLLIGPLAVLIQRE